MKFKFFIWCFFFLTYCKSFSQFAYEVNYGISEIKLNEPFGDADKRSKEIVKKIVEYAEKINYVLIAKENKSFFTHEKFMVNDDDPLNKILLKGAMRFTSFNEATYINLNKDSLIFIKNLVTKDFTVKRDIYDFKWILAKDEKKILGYDARKAKGTYFNDIIGKKVEIEAWYIPSIPLRFGPDIFVGLPGLIAELHLERAVVSVESIKKKEDLEVKKIVSDNIFSLQEFNEVIKKLTKEYLEN